MNVSLYKTNDENNVIGKKLAVVGTTTAIVKGELSLEHPTLILQYNANYNNANYIHIGEYGRYYYITDRINLTGGRMEIHCDVDVLESFKNDILALSCIINKQENSKLSNMYYNDGSFVASSKEFIYTKNFPNGFNDDGEFILITAGGGE